LTGGQRKLEEMEMKAILLAALFALGVALAGSIGASTVDAHVAIHKAENASTFTMSARRRHRYCRYVEVCRGPWWARVCQLERVCTWR
jgi:hypothetical protein